ncbi:U3 small nucleolar RNA-associated protein 13 [Orbilia oligospora]|uniref:U3 small nucleolar RNA-associated protein 13 n=1 Tax=Orbilia oligospora TaxID=2813651 RepID=A0A7C8TUG0_ORBOL|nr:U3 small nucleolar RNA-associated protein 13 [Orbilia oligospora]TGJ68837.1 U3 small nucleolar RNA-associated protein 13 [Orbilia oligospora]
MAPPLLKTAFKQVKVLQSFYTGGKCALSGDGRILASTLDEDVILTDMETGQELARVEGDTEIISTLAITPNASHLVTCSKSFMMRIYTLTVTPTGITATLARAVKAHDAPVITSAIDPTGTLFATGGSDGLVKVWDIKGGFVTHNLRGHGGVISALSFFAPPDRNAKKWRLASGADDTKIIIWDLSTRKMVKTLEGHNSVVRGLDWSVDGKILVSGGRDAVFIIWETKDWSARGQVPVIETLETVGLLAPGAKVGQSEGDNSQVVYTAGDKGSIRLWSSSTGKSIPMAKTDQEDEIVDVIYSKKTNSIISVHNDQTLLVRSLAPNLPIARRISGHHDEIIDLQYLTSNDSLIALATNSEDIRILSPSEGSFGDIGVLKGHSDIAICLDRDPTGNWLLSGGKDNEARLWKIDPENPLQHERFTCYARFVGHTESLGAVALSRSEPNESSSFPAPPKFLITGSKDSTIKRWEVPKAPEGQNNVIIKSSKALFTRKAHDKDINFIDISSDDKLFATASQDRTIKVWSAETGETVGICKGHRRGVWSVRFGPSHVTASTVGGEGAGRLLLSASGDKTVRLWNLADYSCLKTFEGHAGIVLKAMWLNNGLQVASAGGEGLVKIWEARTGECVTTLDGHEDKVWALAGSRDESIIVTGGGDSVVSFWKDVSEETREERQKEEEKKVEQEQKLANYIQAKDYKSAIILALELNYPYKLLNLFTAVINSPDAEKDSIIGLKSVDEVLANLKDYHLYLLLCRIRDWNTNSRTSNVAQRVLSVLLRSFPAEKIVDLKVPTRKKTEEEGEGQKKRKGETMIIKDIMEAMERYTERHYGRVEDLVGESYIVEYTLNQMEEAAFVDDKKVARALVGKGQVNGIHDDDSDEEEEVAGSDNNEEEVASEDEDEDVEMK